MRLGSADQEGATELRDAEAIAGRADIMAINFTVCFIPGPVRHLASQHASEIGWFRHCRRCVDYCYGYDPPETHSNKAGPDVDHYWADLDNEQGRQGTSSLFAVKVALALGYRRVILAGIPLDGSGRFYDPPGLPLTSRWNYSARPIRAAWERAAAEIFEGRVTSVGDHWMANLLGHPKPEGT